MVPLLILPLGRSFELSDGSRGATIMYSIVDSCTLSLQVTPMSNDKLPACGDASWASSSCKEHC